MALKYSVNPGRLNHLKNELAIHVRRRVFDLEHGGRASNSVTNLVVADD